MHARERVRLISVVVLAVAAMGTTGVTPPITTTTTFPDQPLVTVTTVERPPPVTTTTTTTIAFDPSWRPLHHFALRVAIVGEHPAWNPWVRLVEERTVVGGVEASLFRRLPPYGTMAPMLAAVPEPPPVRRIGDEWVADVPLRPGIRWSDGVPLTSVDVAYSYRQAVVLGLTAQAGYGEGNLIDVRPLDELTVRFVWNTEPSPRAWAAGASFAAIHPAHYWQPRLAGVEGIEALDPEMGGDAPSAGPYRPAGGGGPVRHLVAVTGHWEGGAIFVAQTDGTVSYRNPGLGLEERYGPGGEETVTASWVQGPFASSIELVAHPTQESAVLAAAAGDIDLLLVPGGIDPNLVVLVAGNPRVRHLTAEAAATVVVSAGDPVDAAHPELMMALDCLLDRPALVESLGRRVVAALSVLPPGWSGWAPPPEPGCRGTPEERLEAAVRSLSDAGWEWAEPPRWDAERSHAAPGARASVEGRRPVISVQGAPATFDPLLAVAADRVVEALATLGVSVRRTGAGRPADLILTMVDLPRDPWSWAPVVSDHDPVARLLTMLRDEARSPGMAGHHAGRLAVVAERGRHLLPLYRPVVHELAGHQVGLPVIPIGGVAGAGGLLETVRPATP